MMRIGLILAGILISGVTQAQLEAPASRGAIAKNGTVVSFTTDLAEGELVFTKTFTNPGAGGAALLTYTITQKLYNNGNPVGVQLNRQSFDNYFKTTAKLSAAYTRVIKHAQSRNISFDTDQGWADLITYYNDSTQ
jgi:hypothetical protein